MVRWNTLAIVAVIAVSGGVLAWRYAQNSERERVARIYGPSAAVAGLRAFIGAQGTFRREDRYGKGKLVYANPEDGTGFADLFRIGGPDGTGRTLKFVDETFARATSPRTAKAGYWFVDIVADGVTGPYDFASECGLCAVPAVSGDKGYPTFVVDVHGTVYAKDNGGKLVTVFPDVEKDGWVPVGN